MQTKIVIAILAIWAGMKMWWARISPIIVPVVKEAEQLALDGKIDKDDRKKIVMTAIDTMQKNGTIKLNLLEQILTTKIVDIIAEKLPDFVVSQSVKDIMAQLPK